MKTYAETKNRKPFDWNKALSVEPTEEQWKEMEKLASEWVTCACGNQCDVIPRNDAGVPYDDKLSELGLIFLEYVENRRLNRCRLTLTKIEQRSAYLINQINNQKP